MASADIYFLRDRILVHPTQRTTAGVEIASSPFVRLELEAKDSALGEAIKSALEASNGVVPHPTDWKGVSAPRLAAAGVKSEKAFMAMASLVHVRVEAGGYLVEPCANGGSAGPDRGFSVVAELSSLLSGETEVEHLGSCVRRSVAKCRGAT